MTFFTDNLFERMMVRRPHVRREENPPAPSIANPCNGCTHKKGPCCSTTCYRDLIILPKKKEAEKCDL